MYAIESRGSENYARAIDWTGQGIDTVYVWEKNPTGCEGKDSIVVKVTNFPDADFEYVIPGANDQAIFTNTTVQNPIEEGDSVRPVRVDFLWNYGRVTDTLYHYQSYESYQDKDKLSQNYRYGYYYIYLEAVNEFGCRDTVTKQIYMDVTTDYSYPHPLLLIM